MVVYLLQVWSATYIRFTRYPAMLNPFREPGTAVLEIQSKRDQSNDELNAILFVRRLL